MIDRQSGKKLLLVARSVLVLFLERRKTLLPAEKDLPLSLRRPTSSFVTLYNGARGDQLRGCIGSTHACLPLLHDVVRNTVAAARDPRFEPVQSAELAEICIHISVLHRLQRVRYLDYEDLLDRLQPGVDGVMVSWQEQKALLLPQVWERLPQPRRFMQALCQKAQIPRRAVYAAPPQLNVATFKTSNFSEPHVALPCGGSGALAEPAS